jgi:hypothetical protein
VPVILRSEVTSTAEGRLRRRENRRQHGQTGRLCEASGYLALNNGQRQFAAECLAPRVLFEPRFTSTVPGRGYVTGIFSVSPTPHFEWKLSMTEADMQAKSPSDESLLGDSSVPL